MGLAGFEPAKSRSEGGYPIQTRLQAQCKKIQVIVLLSIISKKFLYRLNTRKSNFLICEIIHISKKRL